MPSGRNLTWEQHEFILENKDKMFISQIAKKLGLSYDCVHNHVKDLNSSLERKDKPS